MNKLPWEVPYEKINRGCIYLVGFSFDDGRPLTFVEKDSQGNIKLIDKDYGFEPKIDKNGRSYSPEVSVVIPHKAKYAIVLQTEEENINPEWKYTIVAPIDSIDFSEKNEPIIQRAMIKNDVPKVYYTKCTGIDALVQITKIRRIHKSLIFRKTSWKLDEVELNNITYKIASILEVEKIPACNECETNCDNCKLKSASGKI